MTKKTRRNATAAPKNGNDTMKVVLGALIGLAVLLIAGIAALFGIDFDTEAILGDGNNGDIFGDVATTAPVDNFPNVEPPSFGWYEVYFTDPSCPPEEERVGGVDQILADDLLQATDSVDVAAYELNAEPIVNALIELEGLGVPVRVVIDADNADESGIRRLRRNGISVVEDTRTALMHHKFIVIDKEIVWAGSMNLTTNGAYCNNNNFVRFELPALAANYTAEMDEMYIDRSFGPRSPVNIVNRTIEVGGSRIDNYMGAEDEIAPVIAEVVAGAEAEVLFMAFSFTHDEIGQALIARARDGVRVQGVFEAAGSENDFSYYAQMLELSAGLMNVGVRQDGNGRIMHHKVFIIDRTAVVFGSFNFSNSANDNNDESVIIIYDPEFATFFVEEFEAVWEEAVP